MAQSVGQSFYIPISSIVPQEDQIYGTTPPESPIKRMRELMQSSASRSLEERIIEGHRVIALKHGETGGSVMPSFSQLVQTFRRPIEEIDGFPANDEFFRCNLSSFESLEFLSQKLIPLLMERGEHPAKAEEVKRFRHEVEVKRLDKKLEAFRNNIFIYFSYIHYFASRPQDFEPNSLTLRELKEIFSSAPPGELKAKAAVAFIERALEEEAYPSPPLSEKESELSSCHDYPVSSKILIDLAYQVRLSSEDILQLLKRVHPSFLFAPQNYPLISQAFHLSDAESTVLLRTLLKEMPLDYFSKWMMSEDGKQIQEMVKAFLAWSEQDTALAEHLKVLLVVIEGHHPNLCEIKNRNLSNYVALARFFDECQSLGLGNDGEVMQLKNRFLQTKQYSLYSLKDLGLHSQRNGNGLFCKGSFMLVILKFLISQKADVLINIFDQETLSILPGIKIFEGHLKLIYRAFERQKRFESEREAHKLADAKA